MRLIPSCFFLAVISLSGSSFASDQNPFLGIQSAMPLPGGPLTPPHPVDEVSPSYTENRNIFDSIELVGLSESFATLRYPLISTSSTSASGGAQGVSYKVSTIKKGGAIYLGGRSYKVSFDSDNAGIKLIDKGGKVAWEGDLSTPKVYQVTPMATDQQWSPPLSAGVGVGGSLGSQQAPGSLR